MTPVAGAVVLNFTSDPQVRYDRFTARWYLTIIDVPCTNATCTTTAANRLLMAVSDAASAGTISGTTVWTFFQFQADPGTNFCDYPSLGIDVNALYIGCNMFTQRRRLRRHQRLRGSQGLDPRRRAARRDHVRQSGGRRGSRAGVAARRRQLRSRRTEGYFVGPDNAAFSTIIVPPGQQSRVSDADDLRQHHRHRADDDALGHAAIRLVQHAGNTGGNNGLLDTLDDRFYQR